MLLAYRTTTRSPTGETPFNLVYGSEAVLPVEVGQAFARVTYYSEDSNRELRDLELDSVEKEREKAAIRMESYKSRVARTYNRKVRHRDFQVGDLVLKKVNPAGSVGKLEAKWEGPYRIHKRVSTGALYLADDQGRVLKRPWNAFHLKRYYS